MVVSYEILHQFSVGQPNERLIWTLEDVVIDCLQTYGIKSGRKNGLTGVWVEDDKICAMGVRLSKWVTMHGFAFNLDPDMTYFDGMIPCGIFEYGVTSLEELDIQFSSIDIQIKIMNLLVQFVKVQINFLIKKIFLKLKRANMWLF